MEIIKVSAKRPDGRVIAKAARVVKGGGLVIFPTETVYGLGADAFNADAVAKIFRVKGRPQGKPLIVHVSKKSTLDVLARDVPPVARKLVKKFWPGPLTLVFYAQESLPQKIMGKIKVSNSRGRANLTQTVAVRMPDHSVALALIRLAGSLAAPSANFSGDPPPRSVCEISHKLLEKVDLVLDAGKCPVGVPSTVLDLTQGQPKILRPGAISKKQLEKVGLHLA